MRIEWVEQCKACNGRGLYVGLGEGDGRNNYGGASVVCGRCKGTGRKPQEVEYLEFKGRVQPHPTTTHVWACNPGIMATPEVVSGGVPVQVWLENPESVYALGAEMRSHTCPAWWYQTAGKRPKPNWDECGWGRFSDCQHFDNKATCWRRFDTEA